MDERETDKQPQKKERVSDPANFLSWSDGNCMSIYATKKTHLALRKVAVAEDKSLKGLLEWLLYVVYPEWVKMKKGGREDLPDEIKQLEYIYLQANGIHREIKKIRPICPQCKAAMTKKRIKSGEGSVWGWLCECRDEDERKGDGDEIS